jgi:CheY-like chemotaxis protein
VHFLLRGLLVVDDEESLYYTAAILEKEGYVVDTARADEAIELLQKLEYDLVLTDLHMEGAMAYPC